jgi:hypothetical protein
MDSMQACRNAAVLFGAASTMAGCLWRMLPDGMKRLADGGGYNRLVAACRMLLEEDLEAPEGSGRSRDERLPKGRDTVGGSGWGVELGDPASRGHGVEGLRGLDLNVEGSGPHYLVQSSPMLRSPILGDRDAAGQAKRRGQSLETDKCISHRDHSTSASVGMTSYRLTGLDALFSQMDEALGDSVGRKSGKFAVARRVSPSRVLDEGEVLAGMGTMEGWLPRRRRDDDSAAPMNRDGLARVQRRVRVWVHAVRLVPLVWVEGMECFVPGDEVQPFSNGFVSDWIVGDPEGSLFPMLGSGQAGHGGASGWKDSYSLEGKDWRVDGTPTHPRFIGTQRDTVEEGEYVVFTAIEVAEKRGRHWVRLPWCCKMRVQDVVFEGAVDGAGVTDDAPTIGGSGEMNGFAWKEQSMGLEIGAALAGPSLGFGIERRLGVWLRAGP